MPTRRNGPVSSNVRHHKFHYRRGTLYPHVVEPTSTHLTLPFSRPSTGEEMQPELIAVYVRGIVLILTTLAGIMCIYLGWRLYFENIKSSSKLEATAGSGKFSLQSTAPGVFFVLFGAALLIYVLKTTVEFEDSQESLPQKKATRYDQIFASQNNSDNLGHPTFSSVQRIYAQSKVGPATDKPAAEPPSPCIYRSRKFKWFDDDDNRSEREQIVDTLSKARAALIVQLQSNAVDSTKVRRHILILEQVQKGFSE